MYYSSLTLTYSANAVIVAIDFPKKAGHFPCWAPGPGTKGHSEDKPDTFPESVWRCSLCVSNNALAAHMNLTSMNLSKSFFILFIFVDYATS